MAGYAPLRDFVLCSEFNMGVLGAPDLDPHKELRSPAHKMKRRQISLNEHVVNNQGLHVFPNSHVNPARLLGVISYR